MVEIGKILMLTTCRQLETMTVELVELSNLNKQYDPHPLNLGFMSLNFDFGILAWFSVISLLSNNKDQSHFQFLSLLGPQRDKSHKR